MSTGTGLCSTKTQLTPQYRQATVNYIKADLTDDKKLNNSYEIKAGENMRKNNTGYFGGNVASAIMQYRSENDISGNTTWKGIYDGLLDLTCDCDEINRGGKKFISLNDADLSGLLGTGSSTRPTKNLATNQAIKSDASPCPNPPITSTDPPPPVSVPDAPPSTQLTMANLAFDQAYGIADPLYTQANAKFTLAGQALAQVPINQNGSNPSGASTKAREAEVFLKQGNDLLKQADEAKKQVTEKHEAANAAGLTNAARSAKMQLLESRFTTLADLSKRLGGAATITPNYTGEFVPGLPQPPNVITMGATIPNEVQKAKIVNIALAANTGGTQLRHLEGMLATNNFKSFTNDDPMKPDVQAEVEADLNAYQTYANTLLLQGNGQAAGDKKALDQYFTRSLVEKNKTPNPEMLKSKFNELLLAQ